MVRYASSQENPEKTPKNLLHIISELIGMMEFLISFMIRIRDNSHNLEFIATHDQLTNCRNRTALNWLYNIKADSNMSLAVLISKLQIQKCTSRRKKTTKI